MSFIAVDFDGSVVTHKYPKIGKDIGAVPVLKRLVKNGHQLIIWTMRDKKELAEAVNWYVENDIPYYGVNQNLTQQSWTSSPKAYAELYIDDAAAGCPVKRDKSLSERPFVDWAEMESWLDNHGYFQQRNRNNNRNVIL